MANRRRDLRKEQFWRQHLTAWRRSGQGIRKYCEKAGLAEPSFYAWRSLLAKRDQGLPAHALQSKSQPTEAPLPAFVPVRLVEGEKSTGPIEVVLRGGRCVRVLAGFAPEALRQVVAVLEDLPC